MSSINLITFDLDDTLWDNHEVIRQADAAHRAYLREHTGPMADQLNSQAMAAARHLVLERQPHLRHHISRLRVQVVAQALRSAGLSATAAEELAEAAFAVFIKARNCITPHPDAAPVLTTLATNYHLASLTNGNADVGQTSLGQFFPLILKAEDVGASKPAPDLFLAAIKHFRTHAHRTVHVGDNPNHDVHGARSAGVHAVWLNPKGLPFPDRDDQGNILLTPSTSVASLKELPAVIAALD